MGMFDYLRCKYPLPVEGANDLEFQTKDTAAQWMDKYEIHADGTLWHQAYDVEDHSEPTAEGLMALLGMATSVNHRWERDTMTGEIRFAGDGCAFSAYFVGGELKHLEILESSNASLISGASRKG